MSDKNITILDQEITIVEYKGERVLTFTMIDKMHARKEGTARKRFNDNKARFTEGEDFFKLPYSATSEIRTLGVKVSPHGIVLLTEQGYLLLAKTLSDDRAWDVHKDLLRKYFRAKAVIENQTQPEALPAPAKPEPQIVTTITQMQEGKPAEVATYNGRVIIRPLE